MYVLIDVLFFWMVTMYSHTLYMQIVHQIRYINFSHSMKVTKWCLSLVTQLVLLQKHLYQFWHIAERTSTSTKIIKAMKYLNVAKYAYMYTVNQISKCLPQIWLLCCNCSFFNLISGFETRDETNTRQITPQM